MATFDLYNSEGKVVGKVEQPALFQTPVDPSLIQRYFVWVRSMLRPTLAHTKTRGDVSGGGKKPWRQKGTGRARVGSTRSPLWRKGGVVFGPNKDQNWATRMPRAERRKALFSALASKSSNNSVVVLDSWILDQPKTKEVVTLLKALPNTSDKKVLHIHQDFDQNIFKSTSNLPKVTSTTIQNMNIIDLMNSDIILMTKDSLEAMDKHFTSAL